MTSAPLQQQMLVESTAEPWKVGAQNIYGARAGGQLVAVPDMPPFPGQCSQSWKKERLDKLNDWGGRREEYLHRRPRCLMDQMVSGSGLFPPRLLNDTWFTPPEQNVISRLERILEPAGRAYELARDILTPMIYGIKVKIILDDSGSMSSNMFGRSAASWADQNQMLQRLMQPRICCGLCPSRKQLAPALPSPISPWESRWKFALDALKRWHQIFSVMGIDPDVYLMSGPQHKLSSFASGDAPRRGGSTPSTETLLQALTGSRPRRGVTWQDLRNNSYARDMARSGRQLVLILTDGEANEMESFMQLLDLCQNGVFGDIQICFLGISLEPSDIKWFEEEECEETRIRTIEPFEVEQRQIRTREVVQQEAGYNFDMHSVRALVTNFYPADYDYEAPLQNLRHRLYITLHGRDRWWGDTIPCWRCLSCPISWTCFIGTGACCCGWCQGNECGKCSVPECFSCESENS